MIHKYDKSAQIHDCIAHIFSTQLLIKYNRSIPLGRNIKKKTTARFHTTSNTLEELTWVRKEEESKSTRFSVTQIQHNSHMCKDVGDETSWALPFFFVLSKTSSSHLSRPSDGNHGVSAGISIRNQRRVGRLTVRRSGLLHWDEFGERTVRSIHCSREE